MGTFSGLDIDAQNAGMEGSPLMGTKKLPPLREGLEGTLVYSAQGVLTTWGHRQGEDNEVEQSLRQITLEFGADGEVNIAILSGGAEWIGPLDLPAPFGEQLYALLFGQ